MSPCEVTIQHKDFHNAFANPTTKKACDVMSLIGNTYIFE